MNSRNTILTIRSFGQGLRTRYKRPRPINVQENWLFFVKDGTLEYSDGKIRTLLSPDHLYVLPADKSFLLKDVDDKRFDHFYIETNCTRPIRDFIGVNVAGNTFLSDFFKFLMKHVKSLDSIMLADLLNTVLPLILPSEVRGSDTAEKIKMFIDGRLPLFSVSDVIAEFHYSKRYLDKKFKDSYKTSMIRYGKTEQLSFVADALTKGETLTDICYKINYSSPANLSRDFKKHYGFSPAEYKKISSHDNGRARQSARKK